jgi:hypothetical protein
VLGIFEIGSCEPSVHSWLQTLILLISASWVPRITGMSYQHPAKLFFLFWEEVQPQLPKCWDYRGVLSYLAVYTPFKARV